MDDNLLKTLIAVGGTILGSVGSFIVSRLNKEKRRLQLSISPVARLLEIGSDVRSDVQVLYRGEPVEGLWAGEFAIQNTGNTVVKDIEIVVKPDASSPLADFEVSSANFSLNEDSIATSPSAAGGRRVAVKYLNQNDRFILAYRILGKKPTSIVARQEGVEIVSQREFVSWLPDIYAEMMMKQFSQIPGFGLLARFMSPYKQYYEAQRRKAEQGAGANRRG